MSSYDFRWFFDVTLSRSKYDNNLPEHTEGSVLAPLLDISPNKLRQCRVSYVIECVYKYTGSSHANNLVDVYDPSVTVIIQFDGLCLVHDQD